MTTKSPFKFLDSYTKEDKDIFFGRNQEIEQLYQKVFESKLLLVYGVSGTGKSSLIQCGLANKFNDSDWLPINIRRGSNINESLNKQITQNLLTEVKETASLKKKINSLYLDHFKPIYLIFDQFEELFIFGSDTEKDEFIQTVKKLVESDIQCKLIFAIREEYLANITEFERKISSFLENRLRIEKMRPAQAKDCIEGPCRYANIDLEEGVSKELLKRLTNDKNEIELTWLQVFLDKLYRTTTTDPKEFTHALLQQMGKVSDLLGSFLDKQITQSSSPDETLAILKSFVSIKGTKWQITLEEVQSYCQTIGKQIDETDLKIKLQQLVSLRILRDKDENSRYELRHDALAAKIYEKITLVEKELMEVRQFIENAYANYQKRKVLLSNEDLSYIAVYEDKIIITKELQRFIELSKAHILKSKRRKQIISIGSGILLLVIFAGFTIWALNERNNAIKNEQIAIQQKYIIGKEKKKNLQVTEEIKEAQKQIKILKKEQAPPVLIIAAIKMNILYVGIENPIAISVPGISYDYITPELSQGELYDSEIQNVFNVKPIKTGSLTIKVYSRIEDVNKLLGYMKFKVLPIPKPKAKVMGLSGGRVSHSLLISSDNIYASLDEFIFDLKFRITSFSLTIQEDSVSNKYSTTGSSYSSEQKDAIKNANRGDLIYFENIKAVGPDGKELYLNTILFELK